MDCVTVNYNDPEDPSNAVLLISYSIDQDGVLCRGYDYNMMLPLSDTYSNLHTFLMQADLVEGYDGPLEIDLGGKTYLIKRELWCDIFIYIDEYFMCIDFGAVLVNTIKH